MSRRRFHELQQCLHNVPVLAPFDENVETEVLTGNSDTGLGTITVQKQSGCENVNAFASGGLSN